MNKFSIPKTRVISLQRLIIVLLSFFSDSEATLNKCKKRLVGTFTNYTHNSENQLTKVESFTNNSLVMEANYKYNALGQRMMKQVVYPSDTSKSFIRKFTFDGDEILSEFDGDNNRLVTYTHSSLRTDDTLSADVTTVGVAKKIAKEAGSFFFLKDALGSITDITDSSGYLKEHIAYSSFGSILNITDENNIDKTTDRFFNFRYSYTNRELDSETGLFYYRARYYDSKIGRFVQEDPHPGKISIPNSTINKYIYTANNPISYTDPSGEFLVALGVAVWSSIILPSIVAAIASTLIAASLRKEGNFFDNINVFKSGFAQNVFVSAFTFGVKVSTAAFLTGGIAAFAGLSASTAVLISSLVGAGVGGYDSVKNAPKNTSKDGLLLRFVLGASAGFALGISAGGGGFEYVKKAFKGSLPVPTANQNSLPPDYDPFSDPMEMHTNGGNGSGLPVNCTPIASGGISCN